MRDNLGELGVTLAEEHPRLERLRHVVGMTIRRRAFLEQLLADAILLLVSNITRKVHVKQAHE